MSQIGPGGVRALFFAYFAFVGAFSPYLALYFAARGVSIVEIGVLMSLPQALRIVAPAFWGWLADRDGRRVLLLRISALMALAAMLAFPAASSSLPLFVLMLVLFFATAAQMPIGEALALQLSRGDAGRYGRLRLWGSLGFAIAVLGIGPLLDRFGIGALPWLMAVVLGALAAISFALREQPLAAAPRPAEPLRRRLREPRVIAFLVSAFLMIFAHAAFYAFFSLYCALHGYSTTAIGVLWTVGVAAEIVLFMMQSRLFARFDALRLLALTFVACAIRFAMIAGSDGALAALVVSQLLHALTFGLHHSASMAVLHDWFPPSQQARAQAVLIMISYGLGGTIGGLAASWLWAGIAPPAAFVSAAIAGVGGWVAVVASRRLGYARPQSVQEVR